MLLHRPAFTSADGRHRFDVLSQLADMGLVSATHLLSRVRTHVHVQVLGLGSGYALRDRYGAVTVAVTVEGKGSGFGGARRRPPAASRRAKGPFVPVKGCATGGNEGPAGA